MPKIAGFTLIEVMISLLLISIIMLGMDITILQSLHQNQKTYYLSVAINEIQNLNERLQALKDNSGLEQQLKQWNEELKTTLPKPTNKLTGNYPNYEITLSWGNKEHQTCQSIYENCLKTQIYVA